MTRYNYESFSNEITQYVQPLLRAGQLLMT